MGIDYKRVLALLAAVAIGVFAWNTKAIYPLKLLVVLIHESGHALAAKAVGGTVDAITLDPAEGGETVSRTQDTFFRQVAVSSGGYLGSALAGALLLIATLRFRGGRWVLGFLSAGLLVVCVLWARNPLAIGVSLGMAVIFGLAAKFFPRELSELFAIFIGAFTSLYALFDLKDDLWSAERRAGTDAAILARTTHVPSIVWAVLWSLVAIAMIALAVWIGAKGKKAKLAVPAPRPRPAT